MEAVGLALFRAGIRTRFSITGTEVHKRNEKWKWDLDLNKTTGTGIGFSQNLDVENDIRNHFLRTYY